MCNDDDPFYDDTYDRAMQAGQDALRAELIRNHRKAAEIAAPMIKKRIKEIEAGDTSVVNDPLQIIHDARLEAEERLRNKGLEP